MAAIAVTAAQVGLVDPIKAVTKAYIAGVAIAKGEAVYIVASTGKVALCDAGTVGKYQFRGIALNAAGIGGTVQVVENGDVHGFTLSGDYDSLAYVGDVPGALADSAGSVTIVAGRVVSMSDHDLTKVLRVFVVREADWS